MLSNDKFGEVVKEYLGTSYKNGILEREVGQSITPGIYYHHGQRKLHPHILPNECWYLNFLPVYRAELTDYIARKRIHLHKYFYHLNSSQIMCLNFFYPLLDCGEQRRGKLEAVLSCLSDEFKDDLVNYNSTEFEKQGKEKEIDETVDRATSFDFYFETQSRKKLFFEIKYTEQGFGGREKKRNVERKRKFENVYIKMMSAGQIKEVDEETFLNNYQILRNLLHVDEDSYVIFVYPEDNTSIRKGVDFAKELMTNQYSKHFITVTWEKLYESVDKFLDDKMLKDYFAAFHHKYFGYKR